MKVKPAITEFALLRHAETEWNRDKRIQGQVDSPLTARGRRQAESWGLALARQPWDCLVASDLGRAALTADLINQTLELPRLVEPRLREQNWGDWSGLKFAELITPEFMVEQRRGWDFRAPGGESRREVLERGEAALHDLARQWGSGRMLVVTHGGVIRCLLYNLCRRRFLPEEPALIEPQRTHWVSCDGEALQLQKLNQQI
jgi:probable phosphoglycerate mutase